MTKVFRHPSARVFERAIDLVLPSVEALAAHKNIELDPVQYSSVARFALQNVPLKSLRVLPAVAPSAIAAVYGAIDHALDIVAVARLIRISRDKNGLPPLCDNEVIIRADFMLRNQSANDTSRGAIIWGNPADMKVTDLKSVRVTSLHRGSFADER